MYSVPEVRHIDAYLVICYDAYMRTTIVIDPEVAQQVKSVMAESRQSMRKVVNDLLRKGLAEGKGSGAQEPYSVRPFDSGSPSGVLSGRFNQMYDEIESDGFLKAEHPVIHEPAPDYFKSGK